MTDLFDFVFSSNQLATTFEVSLSKMSTDFGFENVVKIGDGIVLPKPITMEEYDALPEKDPSAYYFIVG